MPSCLARACWRRQSVTIALETHPRRHVLQFAAPRGRAADAIERMIGNVEFHDTAADFRQLRALREDLHALGDRRRARGGIALDAFDLDQAKPAGSERIERIGRTQAWNVDGVGRRRAHYRSARRNAHTHAIDVELDEP